MSYDCVFGLDLPSITESLYLDVRHTDIPRDYNILINPEVTTYVIRKTVIINDFSYPLKKLEELQKNGCKIITRVWINSDYEFSPYLIRYNPKIIWNGETDIISWSFDSGILHMSKPSLEDLVCGEKGEYGYLGYLAHQVGLHVYPGPYQALDLVKIKKGRW